MKERLLFSNDCTLIQFVLYLVLDDLKGSSRFLRMPPYTISINECATAYDK